MIPADGAWNIAVVDPPPINAPSRGEFNALVGLVETLSMRLNVQTRTIDTLIARIDQQNHPRRSGLVIRGQPIEDVPLIELEAELRRIAGLE